MKKRILSAFTMLCMLLTLLPGAIPAAQASEIGEDSGNPIPPPTVQRQAIANGSCGTDLTWTA